MGGTVTVGRVRQKNSTMEEDLDKLLASLGVSPQEVQKSVEEVSARQSRDAENAKKPPIIVDLGSYFISAGSSSKESPSTIFPTVVGRPKRPHPSMKSSYVGDAAMMKQTILNLSYPIEKGRVTNWDDIELILTHLFTEELRVKSEDQPLFICEGVDFTLDDRQKLARLLFDKFHVPAITFASGPVCSLVFAGRTSGISINAGHTETEIVPIINCSVIREGIQRLGFGGRDLTTYLQKLLTARGCEETLNVVFNDIKEHHCFVSVSPASESAKPIVYELPDMTTITFDSEAFKVPEAYFNPSVLGNNGPGLNQAIHIAITKTDSKHHVELCKNLVLTGGSSVFNGFPERLNHDLPSLLPYQVKLMAIPEQRKYGTWLGALNVIEVKLATDKLITSKDYQEQGPGVFNRFLGA